MLDFFVHFDKLQDQSGINTDVIYVERPWIQQDRQVSKSFNAAGAIKFEELESLYGITQLLGLRMGLNERSDTLVYPGDELDSDIFRLLRFLQLLHRW